MIARFSILLLILLPTAALADEPMMPPNVWEVCSPDRAFCARLDPETRTVSAYKAGDTSNILWTAPGWTRVAALANDGEHLVLGWEGMNLIPVDYDKNMAMLTFFRRGEEIAVVRLRDLAGWLNLQRTVSHYYWGDYFGLDHDGHYVIKVSRGDKTHFDMTTGKRAH